MTAFDGLGKALRWIRDKQAKKQYQVADAAGVTKAMLSAYETGKQKPSIETLEKILGALQVDLADLFSALQVVNERPPLVRLRDRYGPSPQRLGGGDPATPAPDVYEVLGIERSLPPQEEEALAEMLGGFHKLLRFFHAHLSGGVLSPTPPAGESEG
jgi:transcriptional regulator with XRE-family HTH domain